MKLGLKLGLKLAAMAMAIAGVSGGLEAKDGVSHYTAAFMAGPPPHSLALNHPNVVAVYLVKHAADTDGVMGGATGEVTGGALRRLMGRVSAAARAAGRIVVPGASGVRKLRAGRDYWIEPNQSHTVYMLTLSPALEFNPSDEFQVVVPERQFQALQESSFPVAAPAARPKVPEPHMTDVDCSQGSSGYSCQAEFDRPTEGRIFVDLPADTIEIRVSGPMQSAAFLVPARPHRVSFTGPSGKGNWLPVGPAHSQ